MMNKQYFDRSLNSLLTLKDIAVDKAKNVKYFELMKNDFSDAEFSAICCEICKTENLYGKYPDPCLFYQRKPKNTPKAELENELHKFLTKVADYLESNFICGDDRKNFNESLTEIENRVLRKHGGISTLWLAVHRDECSRTVDSVLRELRREYEDIWNVALSKSGSLKLEHAGVIQDKIEHGISVLLESWKI